MSTPKKPHKKRASKYDSKVGINTDFEHALRILGTPVIKQTKIMDDPTYYTNLFSGEFELTKENPTFPPFGHSLFSNKLKKISIELESKDAICSLYLTNANGEGKIIPINTETPIGSINREYQMTDTPFIKFQLDEFKDKGYCRIKFTIS